MRASCIVDNTHDVLLKVTEVDGPAKIKTKLLNNKVVFEGVESKVPFFVGDEISLRYREEFGPRHFEADVLTLHETFAQQITENAAE